MRARVLAGTPAAQPARQRWQRWSAAAAAAVVLVAAGWMGLRGGDSDVPAPVSSADTRPAVVVVDDPGLGLMHGLETFDHLGHEQSELIAEWGH